MNEENWFSFPGQFTLKLVRFFRKKVPKSGLIFHLQKASLPSLERLDPTRSIGALLGTVRRVDQSIEVHCRVCFYNII